MNKLKIDLGCGSRKKEGTIGIDMQAEPGVDYVLNLQADPLPFPDQSVEYIHSAHFLEHLENGNYVVKIFKEISRVCVDGAELELWGPYNWSNSAFVLGHNLFFNEDHYLHLGFWYSEIWEKDLKARWLLKEITYIIEPEVLIELYKNKISLEFALKYYKGVVKEFGVLIEVRHDYKGDNSQPIRTFAVDRSAKRYSLKWTEVGWNSLELENALDWFSLLKLEHVISASVTQPQQTQVEKQLEGQLHHTQLELQQAQAMINAMQTSKFWKLRTVWFKFKKLLGLPT